MKVLHVLYQSLPQVSGSSIRSRDILMTQKEIGIDAVAVTSTFQGAISSKGEDMIDGILYIRTSKRKTTAISNPKKRVFIQIIRLLSLFTFAIKLYKTVERVKPDTLHAHAMFYCAIPAIIIGKIKKIPVVYEFRSLWMYSDKKKKNKLDLFLEKIFFHIEVYSLKKSDYVVFLNKNMEFFFKNKGYVFSNSSVINNAVNTTYINKIKPKQNSHRKELIFGYIGTLSDYEGIEFLVETFQDLYNEGHKNKLLIYGDGVSKEKIIKKINSKKNIKNIEYRGTVNTDEIQKAYSKIDVIINPRLSTKVTNSVTPLKPLEAFAYKKIVIGSNVGGILELIEDKKTGFIFAAEDKESLKTQIKQVLQLNPEDRKAIINRALSFVQEKKSWINNAFLYKEIYNTILKTKTAINNIK